MFIHHDLRRHFTTAAKAADPKAFLAAPMEAGEQLAVPTLEAVAKTEVGAVAKMEVGAVAKMGVEPAMILRTFRKALCRYRMKSNLRWLLGNLLLLTIVAQTVGKAWLTLNRIESSLNLSF